MGMVIGFYDWEVVIWGYRLDFRKEKKRKIKIIIFGLLNK